GTTPMWARFGSDLSPIWARFAADPGPLGPRTVSGGTDTPSIRPAERPTRLCSPQEEARVLAGSGDERGQDEAEGETRGRAGARAGVPRALEAPAPARRRAVRGRRLHGRPFDRSPRRPGRLFLHRPGRTGEGDGRPPIRQPTAPGRPLRGDRDPRRWPADRHRDERDADDPRDPATTGLRDGASPRRRARL